MGDFYAYIRVSTQRQGEQGSSLQEQRDAIATFAARSGVRIVAWFEETETAAKEGRGEFSRMLQDLRRHKARGVIFHKIDRGARNLRDWNAIQELTERGIDVRFAHESLDMQTRGGRLTADMLAVIASDYIRNLKDEVRKGMRGRLKQGLYPLQAPIGYLDQGGGEPKVRDPVRAPLVRLAFELYATGGYPLAALTDELYRRGLRNRKGKKLCLSRVACMLRRSFYTGLIEMKSSNTVYEGIHEPIVSRSLFNRVQDVLDGRLAARPVRHEFLFSRMVRCAGCGLSLIGEEQKAHVYYRCHSPACAVTGIREEAVVTKLLQTFARATLTNREVAALAGLTNEFAERWDKEHEDREQARMLKRRHIDDRLSRLTDALLDGLLEKDLFEAKKRELIVERFALNGDNERTTGAELRTRVDKFLELGKSLVASFEMGNRTEKRELIKITTSNFYLTGKNVAVELHSPFRELANRHSVLVGAPNRNVPRTFAERMNLLFNVILAQVGTTRRMSTTTQSTTQAAQPFNSSRET